MSGVYCIAISKSKVNIFFSVLGEDDNVITCGAIVTVTVTLKRESLCSIDLEEEDDDASQADVEDVEEIEEAQEVECTNTNHLTMWL